MLLLQKVRRRLRRSIAGVRNERSTRLSQLDHRSTPRLRVFRIAMAVMMITVVTLAAVILGHILTAHDASYDKTAVLAVVVSAVALLAIVIEYCVFAMRYVTGILRSR